MQSYLLKKKLKNVNFKYSKTFILHKQKTDILKNLFIITRLKRQTCVVFTKTTSIAKIIN